MADETGRVEAAARALDNYCNCVFDPLWLSCPKCRVRAREALAAADRFDREHGIARIRLDYALTARIAAAICGDDTSREVAWGLVDEHAAAVMAVLREAADDV